MQNFVLFFIAIQFKRCYQPTKDYVPNLLRITALHNDQTYKEQPELNIKQKKIVATRILKDLFFVECVNYQTYLHYGNVDDVENLIKNVLKCYITEICDFDCSIDEYTKFINNKENSSRIESWIQKFKNIVLNKINWDVSCLNRLTANYHLINSFYKIGFIYYLFSEYFIDLLPEELFAQLLNENFIIKEEKKVEIEKTIYDVVFSPKLNDIKSLEEKIKRIFNQNIEARCLYVTCGLMLIIDFVNLVMNYEKSQNNVNIPSLDENKELSTGIRQKLTDVLNALYLSRDFLIGLCTNPENSTNLQNYITAAKNSFDYLKKLLYSTLFDENLINQICCKINKHQILIYTSYLKYQIQNLIYVLDLFLIEDTRNIKFSINYKR